jgi:hypothetical protein
MLWIIRLIQTIERAKREGRTDELLRAAKENAQIQKIMMRPMKYETVNGAGEIGWGTAMLCFALSSYTSVVLPKSTWRSGIGWLLMLCACLAMPLCRWTIKKYVTWPRTGYVAFRRDRNFWIARVVTIVVAVGVSIGLLHLMRPEITHLAQSPMGHSSATSPGTLSLTAKIILVGMGPMNAILYLMMNAVSIREHRWKWLLLVLLALGPLGICFFVPGNYIEVSRPVMLFLGLVCLSSGGATLISFLRHTQPPAPKAE